MNFRVWRAVTAGTILHSRSARCDTPCYVNRTQRPILLKLDAHTHYRTKSLHDN
jgi:hypothetical protein